jgi:hypothetical protein
VAIGITKGGGEVAAGITAVAFAVCAIALIAAGAANLWAGNAMQRRQPNGRIVALALGLEAGSGKREAGTGKREAGSGKPPALAYSS